MSDNPLNNSQNANFDDITDEDFFDAVVNFDWTEEQNTDFLADGSCCCTRYGK